MDGSGTEEVGQQFAKDHGANLSQRNRPARRISVMHARLFAGFSHNCARIRIIFAQKVYPIKDVINFSQLSG